MFLSFLVFSILGYQIYTAFLPMGRKVASNGWKQSQQNSRPL
jgi:hypothetical protein